MGESHSLQNAIAEIKERAENEIVRVCDKCHAVLRATKANPLPEELAKQASEWDKNHKCPVEHEIPEQVIAANTEKPVAVDEKASAPVTEPSITAEQPAAGQNENGAS